MIIRLETVPRNATPFLYIVTRTWLSTYDDSGGLAFVSGMMLTHRHLAAPNNSTAVTNITVVIGARGSDHQQVLVAGPTVCGLSAALSTHGCMHKKNSTYVREEGSIKTVV